LLIGQGTIPEEIAGVIRHWYGELGADVPVAVRSSATAEDLPAMSFAGQLESYLNIRGDDEVLHAVKRCWASLWTGRAIGYRQRQGIRPEDLSMAVVVQQLISAEVAGVVFTANPVTGALDELMINAAWGLGEALVSGRVTPDTIVINKKTGSIASQDVADKEVMTVRSHAGTREEFVPAGKRKRAALTKAQVAKLTELGVTIELLYGQPMDIEWAIGGGRVYIVQARPVTALPTPRAAIDWTIPRQGAHYFRTSVAELLPDPVSPLFKTLALPQWNVATGQIMSQSLGLPPEWFPLVTVHNYVYYQVALSAGQTVRLLATFALRGRQIVKLLRTGPVVWAEETHPRYEAVAGQWIGRDLAASPALELLAGARRIVEVAASYYVSIQIVVGAAYMSEAIFTNLYNGLIKRKSDPSALTFLLGFDSAPIRAEKSLYDLAMWARGDDEFAGYLARTGSKELAAAYDAQSAPIANGEKWREFAARLADHLNRFGHTVYDLDFAKSLPAEAPASLLETLKYFVAGQGRNPYERQAAVTAAREQAVQSLLARLGGPRLRMFRSALRWAQHSAPLREDSLADVGLGWPVLRRMLREVGRRIVAVGAITESNEVFWLKWEELEDSARLLDACRPLEDHRRAIAERRETWQREHGVTPPVSLPVKGGARFLGLDFSRWMSARSDQAASSTIRGIGASPGKVTGPARVIRGPDEFDRMNPGDILVANITTPAWTPLFAMASGIVTDVGGPLSHSSIVAREYGVPAVLGTGVATRHIRNEQQITVDGDAGLVTLGNQGCDL
jgi:pyruvate,water dikinase